MRILFTCIPHFGHFLPLLPIARAMAEAGHDVAFATPGVLRDSVESAGFRWVRAGVEDDDPEMAAILARSRGVVGADLTRIMQAEVFAGIRPRRLVPDLLALSETRPPDLIVHDSQEFGGVIAAEVLQIPHAKVLVNAAGVTSPPLVAMREGPLQRLRAAYGLPPRPIPDLVDHFLAITPFPVSLNRPDAPISPTAHHIRLLPGDPAPRALPAWVGALGPRPLIYVSLGTFLSGRRGREIFPPLLAGLRDMGAEVVVTVGNDFDPATLGPHPEHVHLERLLSLEALLPHCSLVVFHGGSGTLAHVVAHGLPMVIIPLGADQPQNAVRCAELGVSRSVEPEQLSPEVIRTVVVDVLHTPSYRRRAEHLRDEFDRLPGPEFAVELLERLGQDKAPIMTPR